MAHFIRIQELAILNTFLLWTHNESAGTILYVNPQNILLPNGQCHCRTFAVSATLQNNLDLRLYIQTYSFHIEHCRTFITKCLGGNNTMPASQLKYNIMANRILYIVLYLAYRQILTLIIILQFECCIFSFVGQPTTAVHRRCCYCCCCCCCYHRHHHH